MNTVKKLSTSVMVIRSSDQLANLDLKLGTYINRFLAAVDL